MQGPAFLFGGWEPIARILVIGTLGYAAIVAVLKVSGPRTLSQMNSFDFVITIALGATFGRALTAKGVPLSELVAAAGLLVLLQYVAAALQVRSPAVRRALAAEPVVLFWDGSFQDAALRRVRMAQADIEAAARQDGRSSLYEVQAVVLESSGKLSIIPRGDRPPELVRGLREG